jgi:squalene-hopene/tetraprenyl-beta-curcumene cyclase
MTTDTDVTGRRRLDAAVARAVDRLCAVRRPDGSWCDHTSSSALATSVCVMSLHLADRERHRDEVRVGCRWLRETQQADGSWGDAVVDPGNLNSTAFAIAALHLCDPDGPGNHIAHGLAFVGRRGGRAALHRRADCSLSPVVLSLWAVARLCPWPEVPRLPVELATFPKRLWQRVAFTVPAVFALGLLHAHAEPPGRLRSAWAGWAERPALDYLRAVQGSNGGYQESPLLNGVVAVGLLGAGCGTDIADRCVDYILATRRPDGSWTCERDLELSVTTLLVDALSAAGALGRAPAADTRRWLTERQFTDGFYATGSPPGAWTWGYPSGWPDTEDTAGAVATLVRLGMPAQAPPIRLGLSWLASMQNRDGSWGMFVRNSRVTLDRACPSLTARVVLTLQTCGLGGQHMARQAVRYLRRTQRPDGSLHSLWFRDFTYPTGLALEAFTAGGAADGIEAGRCVRWLLDNQNVDGSWGSRRGQTGTVEETASALAALSGPGVSAPPERLASAAAWLVDAQHDDGTWTPSVLGVYYLSLRYSSDHLANAFALRALGRYGSQLDSGHRS